MDYIEQIEKIIKYLEFNFASYGLIKIEAIKRKYNQDYNFLGCFLKDYLILKTSKKIDDEKLYEEFVSYFQNSVISKEKFLKDLKKFYEYYSMIVFEEFENIEILSSITTINLCYCIEVYPLLMEILDNYFNKMVDENTIVNLLKSLTTIVLLRFENQLDYNIDFLEEIKKIYAFDMRTNRGMYGCFCR